MTDRDYTDFLTEKIFLAVDTDKKMFYLIGHMKFNISFILSGNEPCTIRIFDHRSSQGWQSRAIKLESQFALNDKS